MIKFIVITFKVDVNGDTVALLGTQTTVRSQPIETHNRLESKIEVAPDDPRLDYTIDELSMTARGYALCRNEGIKYVGELVQRPAHVLLRAPNFGPVSLADMTAELAYLGLGLGLYIPGWRRPDRAPEGAPPPDGPVADL